MYNFVVYFLVSLCSHTGISETVTEETAIHLDFE